MIKAERNTILKVRATVVFLNCIVGQGEFVEVIEEEESPIKYERPRTVHLLQLRNLVR